MSTFVMSCAFLSVSAATSDASFTLRNLRVRKERKEGKEGMMKVP
jgi:hypothetical protein